MWLHSVVAGDERERRFLWECRREGTAWRAALRILPRRFPRREVWEREVHYTGSPSRTKRDAKEDACRRLLEEQRRLNRTPDHDADASPWTGGESPWTGSGGPACC